MALRIGIDGERGDKNFPRNVERAPKLLVVDPKGPYVAPQAVDQDRVREEHLGGEAHYELAGELVEKSEDALGCRITAVERVGCGAGEDRGDKVVDALHVEESGETSSAGMHSSTTGTAGE